MPPTRRLSESRRPKGRRPQGPAGPRVRLFVMDVDGTMTDGTLHYAEDGAERKTFHSKDGAAVKFLALAGIVPAIITGRSSAIVTKRAAELGVKEVLQGVGDKAQALASICRRVGVPVTAAAYIGDDLSDLPAMRGVAFSAAPADAAPEVCRAATYVCKAPGGRGAVREAVEACLKREGLWPKVLAAFDGAGRTAP